MTFARHQFELSQPQKDGSPLLAHLQASWRATGNKPDLLANAPKAPEGTEQLWADFLELHCSRGSTGFGAMRITFADIEAWQGVRGVRLDAFETDCIRRVDDLWLSEFAPKPKESA